MVGDIDALQTALGHRFGRLQLLRQALTHASTAPSRTRSNERMEFLGDRVLGLVIAEMLFERFPGEEEGSLARRLAALVRRDALARVAHRLDLGGHLSLSPGEEDTGGRENPSLLSDACEAVIAALYMDAGLPTASRFIHEHWGDMIEETPTPPKDAKTTLQEWAQGQGLALPAYREIGRSGPPHAPVFTMEVVVEGYEPATGTGASKRIAAQSAAEILLQQVGDES